MITIFVLRKAGLALALSLAASVLRAGHGDVNVSIGDGGEPRGCSDIAISIGGRPAERSEDRVRVADVAGRALRIRVPDHSGVRVVGSDRRDYEVVVCKAARSRDDLEGIAIAEDSDGLSARGPAGRTWVAYLLIEAPREAPMSLEADNAPIALRRLAGVVRARSVNGPISLDDCSGQFDVEAQNGPIHVSGGSGRVHVRTENGPIGVALSGSTWSGDGLEARAINGPVRLVIPAGYRSGTVVESLGRSPFQCRGDACAAGRRTWDDRFRRFELGEGPMRVRLSTENGPVSVRSGRDREEEEDEE